MFSLWFHVIFSSIYHIQYAWYRLFSTREDWVDMVWKMNTVLSSGVFEYFSFPFVWRISVYNMFLILLLSRYVGNRSSLSWKALCLFSLLLSCLYVCHSVISPSMSPLSPCGFPQTITWLLLLDTISVDLRGWKTRLKETDLEMMMRAACQGEIDLFFPPFFPRSCRPFSSHLCFLHMQAVVRSPE